MDTLQRLRANLESTQEPYPLLADCLREIESLRQQVYILRKALVAQVNATTWEEQDHADMLSEEALAATEPKP